jgi:glycosyltransferase involved in cell wall biosynthesis
MSVPSFSAVVLTLNEEVHIRECLKHLAWCDERIVVDMRSDDRTLEQVRGLATRVILHERTTDFHAARNPGIEAALGDWILVVDADEIIPPILASRLREWAANPGEMAGLWLPRMNYCFGRPLPHSGGFPDYQLRCFRKVAGARYPEYIHGAPVLNGRTAFMPIQEGAWILHVRKNAGIADMVRKWDKYAGTEAQYHVKAGSRFAGPLALLWVPISVFRFRFLTARGYRDGLAGLVNSVMFAFYRFEVEAKMWEISGYRTDWDDEVGRLGSLLRLLFAFALEGYRRFRRQPQRA